MDGMDSILGQPVNAMSNFMNSSKLDRTEDIGAFGDFEPFGNQTDSMNNMMSGLESGELNFSMPMNNMMMNHIGTPIDSGSIEMGGDMNVGMNPLNAGLDSSLNLDMGGMTGVIPNVDDNVISRPMSNMDMMPVTNQMDGGQMLHQANLNMMNNQYSDDIHFSPQMNSGMTMNRGSLEMDQNIGMGPNNMGPNMGIGNNMFNSGPMQFGNQFKNFVPGGQSVPMNSVGIHSQQQLNPSLKSTKRISQPLKKRVVPQKAPPKKVAKTAKGNSKLQGNPLTPQMLSSGADVAIGPVKPGTDFSSMPATMPQTNNLPPNNLISSTLPANNVPQNSILPMNNMQNNGMAPNLMPQKSLQPNSSSNETYPNVQTGMSPAGNRQSEMVSHNNDRTNTSVSASQFPLRQFEFNKKHPPPPRAPGALRLRIQFILTLNQELIKVSMASASGGSAFGPAMSRLERNLQYLQRVVNQPDISAALAVSPPPLEAVQEIPSLTEPYKKLEDMFQFRGFN